MSHQNVRIVLIKPSHPGNIGAAARAMKTMGLDRLYLVEPKSFPHADATARAAGADDIMAAATVCNQLEEAIGDCHLIMGASARIRSMSCPVLTPKEAVNKLKVENKANQVAILFGTENSGLTNFEVDRCHRLIHIPANKDFGSLNLAAAVQIITYELMLHSLDDNLIEDVINTTEQVSNNAETVDMERFYQHIEQTMIQIGFLDPQAPRHVMRRLRCLFNRSRPDTIELNILRGILSAMQDTLRETKKEEKE